MAHDNGKSMVVDEIEADVAIPNGTESLFSFIATAHELKHVGIRSMTGIYLLPYVDT